MNQELPEMSAVIEEEKRLDVRTSLEMYEILKGTGKSINKAVNDALDIVYREKNGTITITDEMPIELYEQIEREFTNADEAINLLVVLGIQAKIIERTRQDSNETRQKLNALRVR